MDGWILVLVSGIVVAVACTLALVYYFEKKRTEEMRVVAGRLGFRFSPEAHPGLVGRLDGFRLFSQGRARKICNVLWRQIDDIQVTLFDYRYTTSSGRHNRSHNQTVVLFETGRLELPCFALRPEHLFHRLAGALGYQDIDFERHAGFSEAYLLQGPDEASIRSLFGDETLAYFARHPGLCAEGEGSRLIFYRQERRVDPAALEGFVEEGLDVLSATLQKDDALVLLPWLDLDPPQAESAQEEPEVVWWE